MNERKQSWFATLTGSGTTAICLSTGLAISLFFGQFWLTAGVVAGAVLILLIIRWANQRDEPFREVLEMVVRHESQDTDWVDQLRRKHQDDRKTTIRTLQQYALAVWILLAALLARLAYLAFVEFYRPS
jgi:hypothetical protein